MQRNTMYLYLYIPTTNFAVFDWIENMTNDRQHQDTEPKAELYRRRHYRTHIPLATFTLECFFPLEQ